MDSILKPLSKLVPFIIAIGIVVYSIRSCSQGTKASEKDSAVKAAINDSLVAEQKSVDSIANVLWFTTRAGRIQKKHPNWTKDDCNNIADNKYWIGMSYDMLKYERGNPSSVNPSNYGKGVQYQCCWENITPSCFYFKEDQIIYAYN